MLTGAFGHAVAPDGTQLAFCGYSSKAYDLHLMDYTPESWTAIQFSKESIPAWEGFPEIEYPISNYSPIPALVPKLWFPTYNGTRIGAGTFGQDALFRHFYNLSSGWDFRAGSPFLNLHYTFLATLPTVSLNASLGGDGYAAGVNLSSPLMRSFALNQTISTGYQRRDYGTLSQTLSARWALSHEWGFDLNQLSTNLSLQALINFTAEAVPVRKLIGSLDEWERLPFEGSHWPHLKFAGGWSDAPIPEKGFRLGGFQGAFRVRGFPEGTQSGRLAVAGSLEFRFPVLSIERGVSLWPVFLDDLSASAFVDIGQAGQRLTRYQQDLLISFGMETRLSQNLLSYAGGPTFVLGVAQGIGAPQPKIYFTMEL